MYGPADAAAHARMMTWVRSATPQQVFDVSVRAGIHDPDGSLTRKYMSEEDWFRQQSKRWFKVER